MNKRVVIIGGGFGGLEAAFSLKALAPSQQITLIDKGRTHAFIPSIHLIISGRVTAREIGIPLPVVLGAAGMKFVQDAVVRVDTANRQVITGKARCRMIISCSQRRPGELF